MENRIVVNILVYDEDSRCFSPNPSFRQNERYLSLDEAESLRVLPSQTWMDDYRAWNNFEMNPNGTKGHPIFETTDQLNAFNAKGAELVAFLNDELADAAQIQPYQPLYASIQVGDCISGWWHVKDLNYNCVVPIQQLPVSDQLKSRLMAWRFRKGSNWLNEDSCRSLNEEGHDLEEHILWELNVREVPLQERTYTKCISCESVESLDAECWKTISTVR